MIVETMSYTEIATCFRKELVKYVPKIQAFADKFSSTVKKTRMYPVSRTYTFDTKDKLRIVMHFVAQKRSDWKEPKFCIFGTYTLKDGMYAVMLGGVNDSEVDIFIPHFFERYRERIVKDSSLSGTELLIHYFSNNPVMYWEHATSSHFLAYKKYESDDVTPLAARIGTGCCFAEMVEHGIFVFKTVISDEMLKEGQTRIFAEMEAKRHRQSIEEGFKGR